MAQPKTYRKSFYQKRNGKDANEWTYEIDLYSESGLVDIDGIKAEVGKGWIPNGGMRLKNIHHAGYRFAYDIGIVGIWVYPGYRARINGYKEPKYLVLGPPEFFQTDDKGEPLKPGDSFEPIAARPKTNGRYNTVIGPGIDAYFAGFSDYLRVNWRSNFKLFGESSDYLRITQKVLFSTYSASPVHEPQGALMAARIHPLIEISYPDKYDGNIEKIRIDYRLHLNLDTYASLREKVNYQSRTPVPYTVPSRTQDKSGLAIKNQAGLFKDEDSPLPLKNGVRPDTLIFKAAEKPLLYEVIGDGLIHGTDRVFRGRYARASRLGPSALRLAVLEPLAVWDNIHWWAKGERLPSAPGAFHAAHLHWRWGKDIQKGDGFTGATTSNAGDAQFKGTGDGGALIDPALSDQSIRVAVITNTGLPEDITKHSSAQFDDFFKKHQSGGLTESEPESISDGADLVLYYSAEVYCPDIPDYRKPQWPPKFKRPPEKLAGNLFVHGLFFAHEDEPGGMSMTGLAQREFYENPSKSGVKKEWNRNPKLK